jgi:tRNA pseudouridine55 synthase
MATGVLIIGVGSTTRLLGIIGGHDKEYTATIRLGASTTTDDREGDVIAQATTGGIQHVTDASIADSVAHFTGALEQRPSAVSAVKVDGKRAYQRVRDGEEVELPARAVTVEEFTILDIRRGDAATDAARYTAIDVDVRVRCSAGTYIRSPTSRARNFVWAVTSPHSDERARGRSTLRSASTSTALISST